MSPRLHRIHEVETYGGKCYLEQQQNSRGFHPSKKEERIYTLRWTKLDCDQLEYAPAFLGLYVA